MFAAPNTRKSLVDVDQQQMGFVEYKKLSPKYHPTSWRQHLTLQQSFARGRHRLVSLE
jgi:hypothetical protein